MVASGCKTDLWYLVTVRGQNTVGLGWRCRGGRAEVRGQRYSGSGVCWRPQRTETHLGVKVTHRLSRKHLASRGVQSCYWGPKVEPSTKWGGRRG